MKLTSSKAKKILKIMSVMATMAAMFALSTVVASAGAGDPAAADATAVGAYRSVMDFVLMWIRRAGAAVGLIGAVMFVLGLKDDGDSSRKTAGLWTMIAGFGVAAVALGADMFHLFD